MAEKTRKPATTVHEHPRRVPVSPKNPDGMTLVDEHVHRLKGARLDPNGIKSIFSGHDRKGIVYPSSGKLGTYKNSDKYDEVIAVWTDYFNKRFGAGSPLDTDVVKALIASESGFRVDQTKIRPHLGSRRSPSRPCRSSKTREARPKISFSKSGKRI